MDFDETIEHESEHTSLDFKATQYKKANFPELLKDVIALANADVEGDRYIIMGVKKKLGEPAEIWPLDKAELLDAATYQQLIIDNVEPELSIDCIHHLYKGSEQVAVLRISNCNDKPYMMKKSYNSEKSSRREGECFIRKGTTTKPLMRKDLDRIVAQKNEKERASVGNYPNLGGYIRFDTCRIIAHNQLLFSFGILVINHSKTQNEHDVYFNVTTSKGHFPRTNGDGIYDLNNHQYRRDDFTKILSYSHGPFQNMVIAMTYQELIERDGKMEIMLAFGGRDSPMKRSSYYLQFQDFVSNVVGGVNPIKSIFSIQNELNVSMNDTTMSEEERVKSFLE